MEVRKNLELVNVSYENGGQKAVMTFLDKERGEVRVVNFNKQIYKDKKYILAETVMCRVLIAVDRVPDLDLVIPKDHLIDRGLVDLADHILRELLDVIALEYCVEIRVLIHVVLLTHFGRQFREIASEYVRAPAIDLGCLVGIVDVESLNQYFVDPQKKEKVFQKFQTKYGVSVEDRDKLVGHKIMVEVKNAFGGHYWGDIKKFPAGRK